MGVVAGALRLTTARTIVLSQLNGHKNNSIFFQISLLPNGLKKGAYQLLTDQTLLHYKKKVTLKGKYLKKLKLSKTAIYQAKIRFQKFASFQG